MLILDDPIVDGRPVLGSCQQETGALIFARAAVERLPDATFDKTLSLLVMNFIPDPEKALREMIRVTRSGGIVAAAVWDYGEGMEMLRVFWDGRPSSGPPAPSGTTAPDTEGR